MPDETVNSAVASNPASSQPIQSANNAYNGNLSAVESPAAAYDSSATTEDSRPELSATPFDKRPLIIGIALVVGLFLAATLLGIWLYNHPVAAEIVRDIFLIYIGIGILLLIPLFMILVVVLIYLALKVNDLTGLIHREVIPMLNKIQETTSTVRGTTSFISEQAVKPVITVASSAAAARAIVRSLFKR